MKKNKLSEIKHHTDKKILFFFFYGTLVDIIRGMNDPSEKTRYAFRELSKSHLTIIASGRTYDMLPESIRALHPNGYLLSNGSYCRLNGEDLFSYAMEERVIEDTIRFSIENDAIYYLESDRKIFTNGINNPMHQRAVIEFEDETPYYDISLRDDRPVNMLMMLFKNEEDMKRYADLFKDRLDVSLQFEGLTYLDCNIKGVNKGSGIKRCLKELGISRGNAYAFGDSYNDIGMMEAVGNPIAMGNAVKEIQKIVKAITGDVIDDGVYEFLVKERLIKAMEE